MDCFLSTTAAITFPWHSNAFGKGHNTIIKGETQNRHPYDEKFVPGDRKEEQMLEEVGKRIIQQSVHAVNPSVGKTNHLQERTVIDHENHCWSS